MAKVLSSDSNSRIRLVMALPFLGCFLLYCFGGQLYKAYSRTQSNASEEFALGLRDAQARFTEATGEANNAFNQGAMTKLEWEEATARISTAHVSEITSVTAAFERTDNKWMLVAGFRCKYAALILFYICLIAIVLWSIQGYRLHRELQLRGYDWINSSDAQWLLLVLPVKSWTAPLCSDFLTIPGNSESLSSLITFLKLKDRDL